MERLTPLEEAERNLRKVEQEALDPHADAGDVQRRLVFWRGVVARLRAQQESSGPPGTPPASGGRTDA